MTRALTQLGSYLSAGRKRKELSLRAVEQETGLSNAYLSQLETGKIAEPSPKVLHKLAELYRVPYRTLLELAGYPVPGASKPRASGVATRLGRVSAAEEEELVRYLEFLRTRKEPGNR